MTTGTCVGSGRPDIVAARNTPMISDSKRSLPFTLPVVWLALGGTILLFAMGRDTVPIAAWIAPVFLLRFSRTAPRRYLALGGLALGLAWLFQFRGMMPAPNWIVLASALPTGLLGFLPYAVDRWLHPRAAGFTSTLIFPCAMAGWGFLMGLFSPYGSWCSYGYSQYGNLPLMQVSAVTGLYGISFLVTWLGSAANWAWEHGFDWRRIRRGAVIFLGVQAIVCLGGNARLLLDRPQAGYARVAGIAGEGSNRLLARSEIEAKAGAQLVFWREGATDVSRSDEPALIQKGADLARRNHIFLGMALISNEAGQDHADLVIAPANDWEAIDPWHTQMAVFRAVENGFNLVRDVGHGRSIATDYMGRSLAETDNVIKANQTIVAYVPTHGVRTIYGAIGDLFAWICIGAIVPLALSGRSAVKPPV